MAATIQCLARSNQSRRVIRATKDTNGHWTVGKPRGHSRSGLRQTYGAPSVPPTAVERPTRCPS